MAEIDFDDVAPLEGLDDTQTRDQPELDEFSGEELTGLQAFMSPARLKIISLVVGGVLLIGGGFFAFSMMGEDSMSDQHLSPQQEAQKRKDAERKRRKNVKYVKLFDGLAINALTPLVRELSFADILFTTEQKGNNYTLLVDEKDQAEARTLLAIKGLPAGGSRGYELLDDSQTLGVTEFDKRIRFLRALSGELERAIIQFDAVEQCKVQIVLPEQRLFSVTQPPVTASILIRKVYGKELSDDNVFSIIQLMSNAVENLQQENVSVIDTEGHVLSLGIFDRMAARAAGEDVDSSQAKANKNLPQFLKGTPIIPKYKDIQQWLDIKEDYERSLEDKAIKQLFGILPLASFKLAITADINPQKSGEAIVPTRITTSMVVDVSNDDIFLDQLLKRQIFNTIAGAIGYERGRDSIQLSKADFLVFSDEEMKRLKKLHSENNPFVLIGGVILGLSLLVLLISKLKGGSKDSEEMPLPLQSGEQQDDLLTLENMSVQDLTQQLRDSAVMDPEHVAKVMEEWLQSEVSNGDNLDDITDSQLEDDSEIETTTEDVDLEETDDLVDYDDALIDEEETENV